MRWGLISDVHANLPALEAALMALEREGVDGIVCAGDLVGYGPHPNEAVELVRRSGAVCVAGNHDLMAIDRLSTDHADELARVTLAWTREHLEPEARAYLEALPLFTTAGTVAVAHGAPDDATRYVRTERDASAVLADVGRREPAAEVLVFGHTHRAAVLGERAGRLATGRGGTVRAPAGERWALNPGSVGQPREWRRVVRFAVLDLERGCATLRSVAYDHRRTTRDLTRAGLPARAAHRRPHLRSELRAALRRRLRRSRRRAPGTS